MARRKTKPGKPAICPAAQAINALPDADRRAVIRDLDALIAALGPKLRNGVKP